MRIQVKPPAWDLAKENGMSVRLYGTLLQWLPFASGTFRTWNKRPDCGHFFGGAYWYGLESASTAMIFAVMAKLGNYDERATGLKRELVKEQAVQAIRYLGFTHDTGPADCVRAHGMNVYNSGNKWGGKNDNFFMASQTGQAIVYYSLAAWLLWDDLDDETRHLVHNVLTYYADKYAAEEPRVGVYVNTQCEENGWTAAGISGAAFLFREHPHYYKWNDALADWSYNTVNTFRDWFQLGKGGNLTHTLIKSYTFHADYTSENHGFLHPGYMLAGIYLRSYAGVFYLMSGEKIPDFLVRNNEDMYERTIKRWCQFDGLPLPVQGQDWWYNMHHQIVQCHAWMNVVHGDADAAVFEIGALDSIERLQRSNSKGCMLEEDGEKYHVARTSYETAYDFEHSSSAAAMAYTYLFHLFGGTGPEPTPHGELMRRIGGVHYYPHGSVVVHRSADSISSFSWRSKVMALAVPRQGLWGVTPLPVSYTGTVRIAADEGSAADLHDTEVYDTHDSRVMARDDGFGATAAMLRAGGRLLQDVAYISLPDGNTVYMERVTALRNCRSATLETGKIGIRNENYSALGDLATGSRRIHFPGFTKKYDGFFGGEPDRIDAFEPVPWLNVDDMIGYVPTGSQGVVYLNQHQYPKWKGVEDTLTLNFREMADVSAGQRLEPFVLVTLPNSTKERTAAYADAVHKPECADEILEMLEVPGYLVYANFSMQRRHMSASRAPGGAGGVQLFDGLNLVRDGRCLWSGEADSRVAGYLPCRYSLMPGTEIGQMDVRISIVTGAVHIDNLSARPVRLTLVRPDGERLSADIAPHGHWAHADRKLPA